MDSSEGGGCNENGRNGRTTIVKKMVTMSANTTIKK